MTIELEQDFFKTFGIEPECSIEDVKNVKCVEKKCKDCIFCMKPQITSDILLKLICILARFKMKEREFYKIKTSSTKILKGYILEDCIDFLRYLNELEKKDIKQQIQQLFKEEE